MRTAVMLDRETLEAIRAIIREEVRPIIREEVRPIIREEVRPIIREEVRPIVKEELQPFVQRLSKLEKEFAAFRLEVRQRFNNVVESVTDLDTRVCRLEDEFHSGKDAEGNGKSD